MDGGDDLFRADALQMDAGGAEVGVAEVAVDDVRRHAFASERVAVAQLVWREAAPDARLGGEPSTVAVRLLANREDALSDEKGPDD